MVDKKNSVLELLRNGDEQEANQKTFGMLVWFLKESLIEDNLKFFQVKGLPDQKKQQKRLILDSQAIEHLELIDVKCSLLNYLDECSTRFGSRLLRQWLISPLTNISKINRRLDCVEDVIANLPSMNNLMQTMKRLPDLDRQLKRLFTFSVKQRQKAVYF